MVYATPTPTRAPSVAFGATSPNVASLLGEEMMEGVEMPIIQRQLGHVSLATTAIYLNHIAPRQVIEAMRKRDWSP